jgi:hypothetical protein
MGLEFTVENYENALHGCGLLGVNFLNIPRKKLNFVRKSCKIYIKATKNQNFLAFYFHYPAETTFLSKLCYTTDVFGGFSVQNI